MGSDFVQLKFVLWRFLKKKRRKIWIKFKYQNRTVFVNLPVDLSSPPSAVFSPIIPPAITSILNKQTNQELFYLHLTGLRLQSFTVICCFTYLFLLRLLLSLPLSLRQSKPRFRSKCSTNSENNVSLVSCFYYCRVDFSVSLYAVVPGEVGILVYHQFKNNKYIFILVFDLYQPFRLGLQPYWKKRTLPFLSSSHI